MKTSTILAIATIAPVAAFAPSKSSSQAVSGLAATKEEILKSPNTLEFGSIWDPLGLAEIGSDETLSWYRHAEVKHGRVAMAAFVGWWFVGAGVRIPGDLSFGQAFASIPSKGLEAWDAVPGWGKAQMLLFAGLIEFHDELFYSRRSTHYMRGGTPGKVGGLIVFESMVPKKSFSFSGCLRPPHRTYDQYSHVFVSTPFPVQNMVPGLFDPFGLSKNKSAETLSRGRDAEIKNGRLAMIGFMGLYAAATIPGSVPLQPDC